MKKKKEKVAPVSAPTKVVNVVFTIPTAFSYESVKVEYSGLADTNEIVEKYNELVDTFRPKPKPIIQAPKHETWRVEHKQYPEDAPDELVQKSEKIAEFKNLIKDEIDGLVLMPLTTGKEYIDYVSEKIGLDLKDQSIENLELILEKLQAISVTE